MIGSYMERHGVNFAKEMVPSKFEKTADGKVKVFVKDAEYGVFDTVLMAVGRTGCAGQLNLEAAGLSYNAKSGKVDVNDNDQTSVPHIFAVGDVIEGKPELTPVAIQAGKLLCRRLFAGATKKMDYTDVATTVFTPIEYGCVGYSEEDAVKVIGKDKIKVYRTAVGMEPQFRAKGGYGLHEVDCGQGGQRKGGGNPYLGAQRRRNHSGPCCGHPLWGHKGALR